MNSIGSEITLPTRDGDISEAEAAFLDDVEVFFGGPSYDDLSNRDLSEIAQRGFMTNPHLYDDLSVPLPVEYLQLYDNAYGTDYAAQGKAMFFRFANAVTKADGCVSHRNDLIVVVAGYTDKMSAFLQTNPGLRSRFTKYLEFEDYTPEQLVEIFQLFCKKGSYHLASSTRDDLIRLFSILYEPRDETFGNGRLARNLYEMTINNQANRIVSLPHVNDEILSTIEETDIPGMVDMQSVRPH